MKNIKIYSRVAKCTYCNSGAVEIHKINGGYYCECGNCHLPCTNWHKHFLTAVWEYLKMQKREIRNYD